MVVARRHGDARRRSVTRRAPNDFQAVFHVFIRIARAVFPDDSPLLDPRPYQFALDHLPGAINWPSLNNDERKRVGTMYVQVSPFEAQKHGAALVAANIARHIERDILDKPKGWQPLVYCWRGGKRSGSLALVLGQIGF